MLNKHRTPQIVAFLSLCSTITSTQAQGFCPPGQYPVAGQGWHYCAGVPGNTDGPKSVPHAQARWINTWLSFAVDDKKGVLSAAISSESGKAAEAMAFTDCEKKGGTACEASGTILNGCLAMATGSGYLAIGASGTKEDAESEAIRKCNGGDAQCHIYHSECALPERTS